MVLRRPATQVVHPPRPSRPQPARPLSAPLYASSAFATGTAAEAADLLAGRRPGYVYSRVGNPTSDLFAEAVAVLEGAEPRDGVAFASGMAAITGALVASGLRAGDRVVAGTDLYGSTAFLLSGQLSDFGVSVERVDLHDAAALTRALARRPKVLYAETVSNPLLRVADVPALSRAAHRAGAALVVDATFSTPLLTRPLAHGADIVVHSATKFLAGHSDVTAGVAVGRKRGPALRRAAADLGGCLSPHEAWLALRGLRTLDVRMERQCRNAARIAAFLARHPAVSRVWHPGHPSHPDSAAASRALSPHYGRVDGVAACCALAAFELRGGGRRAAFRVMDRFRLIQRATTLGGVETVALHPATTSHRQLRVRERARAGIAPSLVRLSAGIEDADDLAADLAWALRGA